MRPHIVCAGGMIAALALPGAALAQKLNLTREGPNLRPTLAVVTVAPNEKDAGLARAVGFVLAEIATGSNHFSKVLSEDKARELLKGTDPQFKNCREAKCLGALSQKLEVDRLLFAELNSGVLQAVGFDWASGARFETTIARTSLEKGNLGGNLEPPIAPLLQKLSTPLGKLFVTTNVEGAEIRWGARLVGKGPSFLGSVPAGTHKVRITFEGYRPYEKMVTVAPSQKAEVEAELDPGIDPTKEVAVEEEFDPKPPPVFPTKPLMRRPGLYTAVGGAVALAVGLALGGWAMAVSSQIRDANGDGVIDVTRADALGAQRNAMLANVVGGVGAVGVGAGLGWMLLDSRDSSAAPAMGVSVHGQF
jgi:PEGA domain